MNRTPPTDDVLTPESRTASPAPAWPHPVNGGATARAGAGPQPYQFSWARHQDEVREAQRLRHAVFAGEMGAEIDDRALPGHDVDAFDAHCEHLLVRHLPADGSPAAVVGTYRLLTPQAAQRAGGFYSAQEFDLSALATRLPRLVELGRSCVHPAHRDGGVILLLWSALARFMHDNGLDTMIGCASVSLRDGGRQAAGLWRQLSATHLADPVWRVTPHLPLPVDALAPDHAVEAPPLIKGYLRCGARLLGAPAWDPQFNTADLPIMMDMADLPARYRRHFLG
ncbi:GNAT family N-acetyltransferase [Ideonella livida]|nr:GNAT family N-acyltransferase [Ideonella livida]